MNDSDDNYILLAPGPVNLHPQVRKILSLPMIHHRTPQFDQILARVLNGLKGIFETKEPVLIQASTGSGGMEALLVNCLAPKEKVIVINSGKFGERWLQMAKTFELSALPLMVPWGEAVKPADLQALLEKEKNVAGVLMQATETSTATAHPLGEISQIMKNFPQTLWLVDGITAVGAYPVPMDQLGIDGLVAGSQKAFMLPTGLSFLSFSQKAWRRIEENPRPRFYFDVRQELAANKKGETWFSSVVPVIRALDFVLQEIQVQGLPTHFAQIARRAQMTREICQFLGLEMLSKAPSDSVTALKLPENCDGQKLRDILENKYQITVMGGQDQLKGKILRIGHMGYILDSHMKSFFMALAEELGLSAQKSQLEHFMENWQKGKSL